MSNESPIPPPPAAEPRAPATGRDRIDELFRVARRNGVGEALYRAILAYRGLER